MKKGECALSKEENNNIESLFSRGFTKGCLFQAKDEHFMNQQTSNHQGIYLGEIKEVNSKKIGILLSHNLKQEDGIRFVEDEKGMIVNFLYNEKGLLIHQANEGDLVFVDNKLNIRFKGKVMLTMDHSLEEEVSNIPSKKISISMKVNIKIPTFTLECSDGSYNVCISKDIVSVAKNYPISKDKIGELLKRLGNTPFLVSDLSVCMKEEVFINIKDINEIRREAIDELILKRTKREEVLILNDTEEMMPSFSKKLEIYATARNEEQLRALLTENLAGIYVDDFFLYQKYENCSVIYRTNRVNHKIRDIKAKEILAGESGSFHKFQGLKSIDYFFNVANHETERFWSSCGAKRICLSPEIKKDEVKSLLKCYPDGNPFEFVLYGRMEVMVLNHCILRMNLNSSKVCSVCRDKSNFAIQDRNGAVYPILVDNQHHTHIFYYQVRNLIKDLSDYYELGIRKFRLEFFDEEPEEVLEIVKQVKNKLVI